MHPHTVLISVLAIVRYQWQQYSFCLCRGIGVYICSSFRQESIWNTTDNLWECPQFPTEFKVDRNASAPYLLRRNSMYGYFCMEPLRSRYGAEVWLVWTGWEKDRIFAGGRNRYCRSVRTRGIRCGPLPRSRASRHRWSVLPRT